MSTPAMDPVIWSQRHPLLIALLALLLLFGGLLAVGRLPIDPPAFDGYPQIRIRIQDPGVPAAIMEARVAEPLEQALADIPGVANIVSVSAIGSSEVVMVVGTARNTDAVEHLATERLAQARAKLPATIDAPQLTRHAGVDLPVAEILLSAPGLTLTQLQKWAEDNLIPQFTDIAGFARYAIVGAPMREIVVVPDQRRLAALGLDLEVLVNELRRYKNLTTPRHPMGVMQASAQTVQDLTLRLANGDTVALSEVAQVQEGEVQDGVRVYRDAVPALRLLLYRQPGVSVLGLGEAFKARLAWLRTNTLIPPAVQVEWMANPVLGLKRMGRSFLALSAGTWLLTLGCIGGLYRRPRVMWLSAVGAALSLMLVFVFYALAGIAINVLALGGILVGYAFALGLPPLVMDRLHHPAVDATITAGGQQVARGSLTVWMSAALVLVPMLGAGGVFGLVFPPVATGLLVTLTASLLVSLVWTPAFAGSPAPQRETSLIRGYLQVIGRLRRVPRWLASGVLLSLLLIPVGVYQAQDNFRFLPSVETGEVQLRFTLPADLSPEQVNSLLRTLEDRARRNGEVGSIITQTGNRDAPSLLGADPNEVVLRIELLTEKPRRRSAAAWRLDFERRLAASLPLGVTLSVGAIEPPFVASQRFEDPILFAATGELGLRVDGPDREVLAGIGIHLFDRLATLPGLLNLRRMSGGEQETIVPQLDPPRAADGTWDDVTMARILRIAQGGLAIGRVSDAGRDVNLRIALPRLSTTKSLPWLLLRGEADNRAAVYLSDIATGHRESLARARWREQQRPMVEVRAALAADTSPGLMVHYLRGVLQQTNLPTGYQGALLGSIDNRQNLFKQALVLLGIASALLLLVGLRLRTLRGALLVLVNVLFAFAGAVAAIAWAGLPLSLTMGLGAMLLLVLGIYPSLMVLEVLCANQGRARQFDLYAAHRIVRPLLVFGVSALLSLVPLASGLLPGFELLQPLALVLSSGLCCSLLGNMFLIPVFYPSREE